VKQVARRSSLHEVINLLRLDNGADLTIESETSVKKTISFSQAPTEANIVSIQNRELHIIIYCAKLTRTGEVLV